MLGINDCLSDGHAAVDAAKGVRDGDCRSGVGDPVAIHHKEVFVSAWLQLQSLGPVPMAERDHGCGRWMPIIERSGNCHPTSRGILKSEGHGPVIRAQRFRLDVGFGGGLRFHRWDGTALEARRHSILWPCIACPRLGRFCDVAGVDSFERIAKSESHPANRGGLCELDSDQGLTVPPETFGRGDGVGAFEDADEIQADETHEGISQSSSDPSRGQDCRSRLSGALLGLLPPLGSDPWSVTGYQSLPQWCL